MKEFDYDAREYIGLFHTSGCVKSAPEPRRLCPRKQSSVELKRNKSNSRVTNDICLRQGHSA